MDPTKSKDKDTFFYEYTVAFGWSKACSEILQLVKELADRGKYLQDKREDKIENKFKIGKE